MIQNGYGRIVLTIAVMMLYSCSNVEKDLYSTLAQVKGTFVPDARTGIFDIVIKKKDGDYVLTGETDHPEALQVLLDSLTQRDIAVKNSVELLPHQELGDEHWAFVNVSVCNLRKIPRHSAELVTQGTLGSPVKVLKKKGSWFLVQTPDRYLGWVDSGGIVLYGKADFKSALGRERIIFTGIYGFCLKNPEKESTSVSDLTSGNLLFLEEIFESYYKISYPDGRIGYVKQSEAEIFSEWLLKASFDAEKLTSMAFRYLGVPYLWGGTSAKGMDCSGFTKTVYFMNGWVLPRDASQQVQVGTLVDDKKAFNALQKGDLLFFGQPETDSTRERVVHVGMWIGDMQFIHASGDVHVSSFDPASDLYDAYNLQRYLRTMRLAGTGLEPAWAVKERYFSLW